MTTVLHITECLGGGVESAIAKYIQESPKYISHHVLSISGRNHDQNGEIHQAELVGFEELQCFFVFTPVELWKRYLRIRPDFVHLHSAFAGVFGRISFIPKSKIIYTPHCYAFEITSKSALARFSFRIAEELLATRTGTTAACGRHEATLAQSLFFASNVVALNNAVNIRSEVSRSGSNEPAKTSKIGMLGRVCKQKGVDFFIQAVQAIQEQGIDADFYWIGGGDEKLENQLTGIGVKVTGWVSKAEAIRHLSQLDAYIHSAAWEGNPISVIEAASLSKPIFARRISSIAVYGSELCFEDPNELGVAVAKSLASSQIDHRASELSKCVQSANLTVELRSSLRSLYKSNS